MSLDISDTVPPNYFRICEKDGATLADLTDAELQADLTYLVDYLQGNLHTLPPREEYCYRGILVARHWVEYFQDILREIERRHGKDHNGRPIEEGYNAKINFIELDIFTWEEPNAGKPLAELTEAELQADYRYLLGELWDLCPISPRNRLAYRAIECTRIMIGWLEARLCEIERRHGKDHKGRPLDQDWP